jgi:hypothetical protein
MGIHIHVKKHFFYGNEVGGTLGGTRQGPVLQYLCRKLDIEQPEPH